MVPSNVPIIGLINSASSFLEQEINIKSVVNNNINFYILN